MNIPELLKELQATDSLSKRMDILEKNKISQDNICEACKSAYKFNDLGMCVMVEWCRWTLDFPLFKTQRQAQNSIDCANFLDDECIRYTATLEKENHEKCKNCKNFCKKED